MVLLPYFSRFQTVLLPYFSRFQTVLLPYFSRFLVVSLAFFYRSILLLGMNLWVGEGILIMVNNQNQSISIDLWIKVPNGLTYSP